MAKNYDLVIIGGGTGGYVAAIRAAQLGMRVALVEKEKVGGTCLHRGCIPSKALLKSAEWYAAMQRAGEFGIRCENVTVDWPQVMKRKQAIVDQLYKGVQYLLKKNKIDVISGMGRVTGPSIFSPQAGMVRVEGEGGEMLLQPSHLILATGSRPKTLPGLPMDGDQVITSDEALAMESLPRSIIIVGGGAIGVEWASLLADFGTEVTLVEAMPHILPTEDEEIAKELTRLFKKRKIRVLTGSKVLPETFQKRADGSVSLDVQGAGGTLSLQAEKILVAVGREAVIEGLGLEATNIEVVRGYIQVDDHYRTKEAQIYAIGDVIGGMQLAHVASREGIIAVETIAGMDPQPLDYTQVPRCTYSRPEVASVGLTEREAKEKGIKVKVGKFPFRAIGKALVNGEGDGFVKMVADATTNDLLGVHLIGAHVTELISEAGLARLLNATPWEVSMAVHPHPTLSEALAEAALAVDGRAIHHG